MPRYVVTLTTSANTIVEVIAPEGTTRDQIADMAVAQLEAKGTPELCVACARFVELGDDWRVPSYGSDAAVTPLA